MKKLLLIVLLIVGCEELLEPSYTTCLCTDVDDTQYNICTEGLTEVECFEYTEEYLWVSNWSSTSSCNEFGYSTIIDVCSDLELDKMNTSHCDFNWYCSGDCEFEELVALIASPAGCMLPDAPNYNPSALLPCTTDCVDEQTGSNCCCILSE